MKRVQVCMNVSSGAIYLDGILGHVKVALPVLIHILLCS